MENKINFVYAIRPVFIYQKIIGLIPFSIHLENPVNVVQISKWNILYTIFVAVSSTFVILVKFWLEYRSQGNFMFKASGYLTRVFIFISAIFMLIRNLFWARKNFNRVIKKIILVDQLIWHQDLASKYRGNRSCSIKFICIYIFIEYGVVFVNSIRKNDIISILMNLLDTINTAIIMQMLFLSWLLIQSFNQIHKRLKTYNPNVEVKIFLQCKATSPEVETKNG